MADPMDREIDRGLRGKEAEECVVFDAVATVEFERTAYSVRENAGQVLVCVAITSRHSYCPVAYDFSLVLMSDGGSAGKISPHLRICLYLEGMGKTSFCLAYDFSLLLGNIAGSASKIIIISPHFS